MFEECGSSIRAMVHEAGKATSSSGFEVSGGMELKKKLARNLFLSDIFVENYDSHPCLIILCLDRSLIRNGDELLTKQREMMTMNISPNSGMGRKHAEPKAWPKSIGILSPDTFEMSKLSAWRSPMLMIQLTRDEVPWLTRKLFRRKKNPSGERLMLWKEAFRSWEPFSSRSTKALNFEEIIVAFLPRDSWKENGKKVCLLQKKHKLYWGFVIRTVSMTRPLDLESLYGLILMDRPG